MTREQWRAMMAQSADNNCILGVPGPRELARRKIRQGVELPLKIINKSRIPFRRLHTPSRVRTA